jgi:hypothetical protein
MQQMTRYFARNIEENRTYDTWKQIVEKTFKHLSGENVFHKNNRCPVYKCSNKNFFEQLSDEKLTNSKVNFMKHFSSRILEKLHKHRKHKRLRKLAFKISS